MSLKPRCESDGSITIKIMTEYPFKGRLFSEGFYYTCYYSGRGNVFGEFILSSHEGSERCGLNKVSKNLTVFSIISYIGLQA